MSFKRFFPAIFANLAAALAEILLMAASAWLIASAALHPPLSKLSIGITLVRTAGISRAALRYADRFISHKVIFKLLDDLRRKIFLKSKKFSFHAKNPVFWIFQPLSSLQQGLFLLLRATTPFSTLKNPIFWIFRFVPQNRLQNRFKDSKAVSTAQNHFQRSEIRFTAPKSLLAGNFTLAANFSLGR